MKFPAIDAHIHFDMYDEQEQKKIVQRMKKENIHALITVSNDVSSSANNLSLQRKYPNVFSAFGFHPEQPLPQDEEVQQLLYFMEENEAEMIAVGEVGLPYYLKQENASIELEAYVEILEEFIQKAKELRKPIILHAVYDDAPIVCDLLEKHSIQLAHFHWFKGNIKTIERMIDNNYYISITPDLLYKERTKLLVQMYPLSRLMVETDGPWPFEGPFRGRQTNPNMIHLTMEQIAGIKKLPIRDVYETIYRNTVQFYQLHLE